jgi:hypothetical protein
MERKIQLLGTQLALTLGLVFMSLVSYAQIGASSGTFTGCAFTFTDPGGAGNYAGSTTRTYTICPTVATDAVVVTFSAFTLASTASPLNSDLLIVYDGNSTSAQVITTLTGTAV